MDTFNNKVQEFFALVQQFKFIEAVDQFYDENIISTDNNDEPVKGMEFFRTRVQNFLDNTEFEKIELLSSITGDDLSAAHWHYVFTNKMYGKMDYKQMSVQRWKDGKIVQENHFYNLGY